MTAMIRVKDQSQDKADAPSRLAAVRQDIAEACAKARRDPAEVTLVAVSKTFAADAIAPVLAAGQRVFGENRVQEAMGKWPALKAQYPGTELHLVGPLQSNKAKEAVALFEAIHSVDRPSLCEALAREIDAAETHRVRSGLLRARAGKCNRRREGFFRRSGRLRSSRARCCG